MEELKDRVIVQLSDAFRELQTSIKAPVKVSSQNSFVFQYEEKGIRQAIIQKLARQLSGLNASKHLLTAGYTQEMGVIFRTLDEILEDIIFLATALTENNLTERHSKFLEAFNAHSVLGREEGSLRIPKPNMPPRKKIRAHTVDAVGTDIPKSDVLIASESVSTAYSGYVHAASENVMEMYGGNPARFHIEGMAGTPRQDTFSDRYVYYVYRGIIGSIAAAKAFGNVELADKLNTLIIEYEKTYDVRD